MAPRFLPLRAAQAKVLDVYGEYARGQIGVYGPSWRGQIRREPRIQRETSAGFVALAGIQFSAGRPRRA
eukprot:10484587-Lingulodinium_polyedra.AAC.1